MTFDPTVFDLALYFCDDAGAIKNCWITKEAYTKTSLAMNPVWLQAVVLDPPTETGDGSFYVANLSRLLPPGQSPVPDGAPPVPATAPPVKGDIVIIPHDEPKSAYIITRAEYLTFDPIERNAKSEDVEIMALNQGVVLANMPKTSAPAGWTCYLLNLISLKSGAVPGVDGDKSAHNAALDSKLTG